MQVTINVTPSLPRGLYIKSFDVKIQKNDIVLVCLNDKYKNLGLTNGYLTKGKKCDNSDPLLKTVVAVPSDDVTLHDDYVIVNNIKLPYPTSHYDSQKRSMSVYPRKTYINTSGYWLIGTHDKNSWDSRYWGPVTRQQIITKLKPVFILE